VKTALALALLAAALLPGTASAAFPGTDLQRLSDLPSRNPAISQDKRFGRLAAFEADSGGTTNVYVVRRAEPIADNGTPWHAGGTVLASRGLGGQPANGPSSKPSLDGTSRATPHCVAFVSAASNLVRGDTNGKPDAFLYDVRTGSLKRVSVNSKGRQSNGTVTEVVVNGLCTRVAFVSDAADLALRKTKNRSWKTATTRANPPGRRQAYIRAIGGTNNLDKALKGLTFLASATDSGRPGDGESHSIDFVHNSDSRALTFASDARNLSARDGNGATDIYQRVMTRQYGKKFKHRRPPQLGMDTSLVSAGPDGRAGSGPSSSPANNADGSIVGFVTSAPDLGAAGGVPQVVTAKLNGGGAPSLTLASRSQGGGPGNGASTAPSLTAGGTWAVFESDATDVGVTTTRGPDVNGVRDAMLSTEPSNEHWLLGELGARVPTTNPMTSPHGNYIVFERGGFAQLLYVGEK
jgi:hypothetical protein